MLLCVCGRNTCCTSRLRASSYGLRANRLRSSQLFDSYLVSATANSVAAYFEFIFWRGLLSYNYGRYSGCLCPLQFPLFPVRLTGALGLIAAC
jgi:hypothetical protein